MDSSFITSGPVVVSSELIAGSGVVHAKPGSHMEDKKCQ